MVAEVPEGSQEPGTRFREPQLPEDPPVLQVSDPLLERPDRYLHLFPLESGVVPSEVWSWLISMRGRTHEDFRTCGP